MINYSSKHKVNRPTPNLHTKIRVGPPKWMKHQVQGGGGSGNLKYKNLYGTFLTFKQGFMSVKFEKRLQHDYSKMRGWGQRSFETFPKNHPFWRRHLSLNRKTCSGLTKISNRLPTLMIKNFKAGSNEISFSSPNRQNRWPKIQRSQSQHNPRAVVGFTAFPKLSPTSSDVVGGQLNRGGALASSSSSPSPPKLPIETATRHTTTFKRRLLCTFVNLSLQATTHKRLAVAPRETGSKPPRLFNTIFDTIVRAARRTQTKC